VKGLLDAFNTRGIILNLCELEELLWFTKVKIGLSINENTQI